MPPLNYITFVCGNTEITLGIYCSKKDLERKGLEKLTDIVKHPLDFKIKS